MARLATLRAMAIACTALLAQGESPVVEASLVKDLGTSFEQQLPTAIANDLAARPDVPVDADLRRALFYITHVAPSFSLRGGTREILRGIIARGLGLRCWTATNFSRRSHGCSKQPRSEERRVGKECGSPGRSRWSPY